MHARANAMTANPNNPAPLPSNALSRTAPDRYGMGQYVKGDVLLASVALDDRTTPKTRPAVVIRTEEPGLVHVCPVSSKPPSDAPCIPISLDDFSDGGLDLFGESYVMTSRVLTITSGKIIGKKGRLTPESLAEIAGRVPAALLPGPAPVKRPGRSRKGR
jgi:mRNA interferase MazF